MENGFGFFSGATVSLGQLAVWRVKCGPEEFVLLAGNDFFEFVEFPDK
jgi:hypothetical protein